MTKEQHQSRSQSSRKTPPDGTEFGTPTTAVTRVRLDDFPPKVRDRATLTVVSGPETGRVYSLESHETLIGRGEQCDVRVEESSVSRTHARIIGLAGSSRLIIEDLGSSNGTFIEGYRVQRQELRDGERIQLGPSLHLRFALTDATEEQLLRGLYESSVRDPLTGVFNRKHFSERMHAEISYAVRHGTHLALILFDIDHFKLVNDEHGHLAGDRVLRSLAGLVSRAIRAEDILARYGGEEFVVIVRGVDAASAVIMAERIRAIVESSRVEYEGRVIPATISAGVATLECCGPAKTESRFVAVADERMYEAKHSGRNRVIGP